MNLLRYSQLVKKACVIQVVLDKWFPLSGLVGCFAQREVGVGVDHAKRGRLKEGRVEMLLERRCCAQPLRKTEADEVNYLYIKYNTQRCVLVSYIVISDLLFIKLNYH